MFVAAVGRCVDPHWRWPRQVSKWYCDRVGPGPNTTADVDPSKRIHPLPWYDIRGVNQISYPVNDNRPRLFQFPRRYIDAIDLNYHVSYNY